MIDNTAPVKAFGEIITQVAARNKNVVVIDIDSLNQFKLDSYSKEFGDRYFNVGESPENGLDIAVGMVSQGKIPFVCGPTHTLLGRGLGSIRNNIAAPNLNIKVIGAGGGLSLAGAGNRQQILEDFAIMSTMAGTKVFCPSDGVETKEVVRAIVDDYGPTYLRLHNLELPAVMEEEEFDIGKGRTIKAGKRIHVLATGVMVSQAILAMKELEEEGIFIGVTNIASLKPIDKELVVNLSKDNDYIFTLEDHQLRGGLGSKVIEVLNKAGVYREVYRLGMDRFGESGSLKDLYKKYGFDVEGIKKSILKTIQK